MGTHILTDIIWFIRPDTDTGGISSIIKRYNDLKVVPFKSTYTFGWYTLILNFPRDKFNNLSYESVRYISKLINGFTEGEILNIIENYYLEVLNSKELKEIAKNENLLDYSPLLGDKLRRCDIMDDVMFFEGLTLENNGSYTVDLGS